MAVATLDELLAAFPGAQLVPINKASIANQLAGGFCSLWRATGTPGQAAIPAAAAIPDKTMLGALLNFTNASGADELYLSRAALTCANAASTLWIADRIAHMGGLSGTTATAQTVGISANSLKGTRAKTDLTNVRWWCEIFTDIGTTGVTATVSYTRDSDGTAGRTTTFTIGGTSPANRAGRLFPIIPQAGEVIRSIETVTHATTATAGSYGFTATVDFAELFVPVANFTTIQDWAQLGLPKIPDDACLMLYELCGTTSSGVVGGNLRLATT